MSMRDLSKAATNRNADECFALLKGGLSEASPRLEELSLKYENGIIDDEQLCEAIEEWVNF